MFNGNEMLKSIVVNEIGKMLSLMSYIPYGQNTALEAENATLRAENEALKAELTSYRTKEEYLTTVMYSKALEKIFGKVNRLENTVSKNLRKLAKQYHIENAFIDVPDPKYGTCKSYHKTLWDLFFKLLNDGDIDFLTKSLKKAFKENHNWDCTGGN